MKNLILTLAVLVAVVIITGCNNSGNGQLIGAQDRMQYNEEVPFGMKIRFLWPFYDGGRRSRPYLFYDL
jgi:hypothetical protein